jgi:hypothetical protein
MVVKRGREIKGRFTLCKPPRKMTHIAALKENSCELHLDSSELSRFGGLCNLRGGISLQRMFGSHGLGMQEAPVSPSEEAAPKSIAA